MPLGYGMGNLTKQVARSIKDPSLNGRWFCYPPDSNSAAHILVESMVTSSLKIPSVSRFSQGNSSTYPGMTDFDGINIVFYETSDYRVTAWLEAWRKKVYDPDTGYYGLPADYRKDFKCEFYPHDSETASMTKTFTGAWPTDQAPFELNYTEIDGRLTVAQQFALQSVSTVVANQS